MNGQQRRITGEAPKPKAVASVPMDAIVKAYLESKLDDLRHALEHAETDKREAEVSMIAQLNRAIGQRDGQIAALQEQIKQIEDELAPDEVKEVTEENVPV